jgi:hypothetical protein
MHSSASVHLSSVCSVLYRCPIISFDTGPGAGAICPFSSHGFWRERGQSNPPPSCPNPSISYKSPPSSPSPRDAPHHIPHSYMYVRYLYNPKEELRVLASQYAKTHRTHPDIIQCDVAFFLSFTWPNPHPSARASSTACWWCSTPPCTSPCSWCSRSIRRRRERSRGWGCSGRSSVR